MYTKRKRYATAHEAIEHEIFPLILGWEQDFDVDYLADRLFTQHYDNNGYFLGVSLARLSDEEYNEILAGAMALAGQ